GHRILVSDWSSDVCSSDLFPSHGRTGELPRLVNISVSRYLSYETSDKPTSGQSGSAHSQFPLRSSSAICDVAVSCKHYSVIRVEIGRASCRERGVVW